MSAGREFVDRVLGLLLPLGPVRARAMFGGHGIFLDDMMLALTAGDRLYFKVDAQSEPDFIAAGAPRFTYLRHGEARTMSYREAPAGALEDAAALLPWAERGLEAARRARTTSGKRRRPRR